MCDAYVLAPEIMLFIQAWFTFNPYLVTDRKLEKTKVETKKDQSSKKEKRKREKENNVGIEEAVDISFEGKSGF